MVSEIIKPRSATYSFQSNMKYNFMRVINHQCILNDARNQSIIRDPSGQYLMAAVLNNLDEAGKRTQLSSPPSSFWPLSTKKPIPL